MRLHSFRDEDGWGLLSHTTAHRRGIGGVYFESHKDLVGQTGFAFVHMSHKGKLRQRDKELIDALNDLPGIKTIPTLRQARLFDDKVAQYEALAGYMPTSSLITSEDDAWATLPRMTYPFMSKARQGAASHNVRLIENAQQAEREIRMIFGNAKHPAVGLPLHYDQRQLGYLFWQDFVPGNPMDRRVVIVGDMAMVMHRWNRDKSPMASGSGKIDPVRHLTEEDRVAIEFCREIGVEQKMPWCAYDVVSGPEGPMLLEVSTSFTLPAYFPCRFFDRHGAETDFFGMEIFDVLAGGIRMGLFE